MNKLRISIQKELLILLNDKVGLSMMFFLPILLVIVITSIQNSALKLVNENNIDLLISNQDHDSLSLELVEELKKSGMFRVTESNKLTEKQVLNRVNETADKPFGLYIPPNFSEDIINFTKQSNQKLMTEIGLDTLAQPKKIGKLKNVTLVFNPIIQRNFYESINQVLNTIVNKVQTKYLISKINETLGLPANVFDLDKNMSKSRVNLTKSSGESGAAIIPNASQHNVPAWSIFAMFFMVIALAGNFVKERNNGSFDRILTMPTNFSIVIFSKIILFWMVSMLQIFVIFTLTKVLFPYINLPSLNFPENPTVLIFVALVCGLTAVNYSMVIGVYAKTVEQANGFGAISVIIFAAIGGIWVPAFILPDLLKTISNVSPLYWCIESFYVVFLKNGALNDLLFPILILILMNCIFLGLIFFKLHQLGYIKNKKL